MSRRVTTAGNNQQSTADTIAQMGRVADASATHPFVIAACREALAALPPGASDRDVARAIWLWIHSHVTFVTDESTMTNMGIPIQDPTKELLIAPPTLLAMPNPRGDCDDFAMLARAMLRAAGMRMSFVTLKADEEQPAKWSHVYGRAYYPGGSMPMDVSHGDFPGWEYAGGWSRREWAA